MLKYSQGGIMVNLIIIITIIILSYIVDLLIKKYVKLSMVLNTICLVVLIIVVDSILFMTIFVSEIEIKLPIMLKLIIIIISILPIICIREYISHTIRILDFCINKNKLLKMGYIEKGIIQEIKSYGFRRNPSFRKDGYYLIVDFNGEKIKSIPFRYHQGGTMVRTVYKIVYSDGKFNKEKMEENLGNIPQLYNVGDEIDVIIYKNKKYVRLKEYEINKFL